MKVLPSSRRLSSETARHAWRQVSGGTLEVKHVVKALTLLEANSRVESAQLAARQAEGKAAVTSLLFRAYLKSEIAISLELVDLEQSAQQGGKQGLPQGGAASLAVLRQRLQRAEEALKVEVERMNTTNAAADDGGSAAEKAVSVDKSTGEGPKAAHEAAAAVESVESNAA